MCCSCWSHKLPAEEFWNFSFHHAFNCIIILFKAIEYLIGVARKVIFRHRKPRNRFGTAVLGTDWPRKKRRGSNLCDAAVLSLREIKVWFYPSRQTRYGVRSLSSFATGIWDRVWDLLQLQLSGNKNKWKTKPCIYQTVQTRARTHTNCTVNERRR